MNTQSFIPFCLCLILTKPIHAQDGGTTKDFNATVTRLTAEELNYLAGITSIRCNYTLLEKGRSYSDPREGIFIDKSSLGRVYQQGGMKALTFAVRFLLAHEMAHQLQFKAYPDNTAAVVCEKSRLLECQADLLAGVLFGDRYAMDGRSTDSLPGELVSDIEQVYDLGEFEPGIQYHPGPVQRRNAFRFGMGYSLNRIDPKNMSSYSDAIDQYPGEDSLIWSMRIARLIMHYPSAVSQTIVCLDTTYSWDPSSTHPFLHFDDQYYNRSAKKVRLNIAYEVYGVRRVGNGLQPDTIPRHTPVQGSIEFFSRIIGPHDTSRITGDLNWQRVGNRSFMPFYVGYSDADMLYNVEALDSGEENQEVVNCLDGSTSPVTQAVDTREEFKDAFFLALDRISSGLSLNDWQVLEQGIGSAVRTRTLVTYKSRVNFPGSTNNQITISIDDKHHWWPDGYMNVMFYAGDNSARGLAVYRKLAAIIKAHYGDTIKWTDDKVDEDGLKEEGFEGNLPLATGKLILSLSCRCQYTCIVSLGLRKHVVVRRTTAGH